MLRNYHIQVFGIVQGVWFRKYTREAARKYGITGYVKNQPDGSVFVEAEGSASNLELFVTWLATGSPLSRVEEIKQQEGPLCHYKSFDISR